MISILGMGCAHPKNIITNDFLSSIFEADSDREVLSRLKVTQRCTSLPLEYIAQSKNIDPAQAYKSVLETPTEILMRAVEQALDNAKIKADQLGLIIGETLTPRETTPCEAQRIGGKLGVKIRAFDITSGATSFVAHLDILSQRKVVSLPDYILLLSTASLTTVTDYRNIYDAATFGDGAFAMVVSPKHPGLLKVLNTGFSCEPSLIDHSVINTYGHLSWDRLSSQEFIVGRTTERLNELAELTDLTKAVFIGQQWDSESLDDVVAKFEIKRELRNLVNYGFVGGASAGAVLTEKFNELKSGDKVFIALAGLDLSSGFALLGVE